MSVESGRTTKVTPQSGWRAEREGYALHDYACGEQEVGEGEIQLMTDPHRLDCLFRSWQNQCGG